MVKLRFCPRSAWRTGARGSLTSFSFKEVRCLGPSRFAVAAALEKRTISDKKDASITAKIGTWTCLTKGSEIAFWEGSVTESAQS